MQRTRAGAGEVLVVAALALAGAGFLVGEGLLGARTIALLLVAVALAAAVWLNPVRGIGIVIATVMFSALVRRLFPAPDPAVDIAALFPHLVAAPLAWRGVRNHPPASVVCLLGWAAANAVLHFDKPLVGIAGWLNLAVPILAALGVGTVPGGGSAIRRNIAISGTIASAYAIAQYFFPFSWDVRWQQNAHFVSANRIGTPQFRPFGTLPASGTMAVVAAVAFLFVVLPNSPLRGLARASAGAITGLMVMLSQVRSVWIAIVAVLAISVVTQRDRAARTIAGLLILAAVVILVVPGKTTLLLRVQTLSDLNGDGSFTARTQLIAEAGRLATPIGQGIGSLSAGSRIQSDKSIDNGYLVVLGELGILGLTALVWVFRTTASLSKNENRAPFFFLVLLNTAGFAAGGITGMLLWSTSGLQCHAGKAERPCAEPSPAEISAGISNVPTAQISKEQGR